MAKSRAAESAMEARGRLPVAGVAIIDIGSNSVRLVAYEGLTRSLTPIFNEKALCGLGKGVGSSGRLAEDAMGRALAALRRFRVLCAIMQIVDVRALATAAVRDASNGRAFLAQAEAAIGGKIELLSGRREAELSALGVVCAIHGPDGVVGDLGGGSLELTDVKQTHIARGVSLPLGGLALMDASERSPRKAVKIVRDAIANAKPLQNLKGRTFYAVGGTWRALARLHMRQRQYPLQIMHNYVIPTRDALEFARLVERIEADALSSIESVNSARRPLLAYGAAVLEEIIRRAAPREIVISAFGVREGLLFEQLSKREQARDPLIAAAQDFNRLRSRAPGHGEELFAWTSLLMKSTHLAETLDEARLRHAACLLSDIGWRAHPDYRGEQSHNLVANAAFIGLDHSSRAYLALAASYRHIAGDQEVGPMLRALVSARQLDRARILGAAMRVAFNLSAGMAGVLGRTPMVIQKGKAVLSLPPALAPLNSERLQARMKQFARLLGGDAEIQEAA